jgi:hypothetical protein
MSEFVKLYYSNDSIKEKCKGSSHKTIDSIKSVMKDLAKKYPQDKYAKGGITREGNHLMHFEPYFEKNVQVAIINEDLKIIRPSHGYWHPNKIGKKSIAWAKRNGYKFIQDGKEFEDGGMMAKGGMSQDEESILVYYVNHYPEDELALEIKAKATFNGLYEVLSNKGDAYEYIGVADSIVRERVFEKLAKIKGVKYDVIYDMWMDSDYAKGGEIDYSKQTSDDFKLGEIVWDTDNNRYGTIIGIYDGYLSDKYEVRLDTDGMQPTENLRKVGSEGDKGTKEKLDEEIKLYARLIKNYPKNNYPQQRKEFVGKYAEGGISEKEVAESNAEMVLSQIKAVKHHAQELSNVVSKNSDIEAWVVAKIERASTDLSDITHYLEFQTKKMAMGGEIHRTQD